LSALAVSLIEDEPRAMHSVAAVMSVLVMLARRLPHVQRCALAVHLLREIDGLDAQ
jgi:hypothetical protein